MRIRCFCNLWYNPALTITGLFYSVLVGNGLLRHSEQSKEPLHLSHLQFVQTELLNLSCCLERSKPQLTTVSDPMGFHVRDLTKGDVGPVEIVWAYASALLADHK